MSDDIVLRRHVSTYSGSNGGECVEVATLADGRVRLLETTDPDHPTYTDQGSMRAFILGAKAGEFDWLLGE